MCFNKSVKTFFVLSTMGLAACGPNTEDSYEQAAFAADNQYATNRIVAFLGDSSGIPGTMRDIPNIKRTFSQQNGFNFHMEGPNGSGWTHARRQTIINETARVASEMLTEDLAAWRELQRGGTLFFYMTSHGAANGSTSAADGSFYFSEVAEAIKRARNGQPLERLIVFFDTCFSGTNARQMTNGPVANNAAMGWQNLLSGFSLTESSEQAEMETMVHNVVDQLQSVRGLYKSAIFLASSRPGETAGDMPGGGVGTLAFLESINAARQGVSDTGTSMNLINDLLGLFTRSSEQNAYLDRGGASNDPIAAGVSQTGAATIEQVLRRTSQRAFGQTPVWCVDPPELAKDFMFDAPQGYLPRAYRNAAQHQTQRHCSQGM